MKGLTKLVLLLPLLLGLSGSQKILVPGLPDGSIPLYVTELAGLMGIDENRLYSYDSVTDFPGQGNAGARVEVDRLLLVAWDEVRVFDLGESGAAISRSKRNSRVPCPHAAPRIALTGIRDLTKPWRQSVTPPWEADPKNQERWKFFWCSRVSPEERVIVNEEALLSAIASHTGVALRRDGHEQGDLHIVAGRRATPKQVIPILAGSIGIGGVHGAGLANALFLPRGAALVELAMAPLALLRLNAQVAAALGSGSGSRKRCADFIPSGRCSSPFHDFRSICEHDGATHCSPGSCWGGPIFW